MLSANVTMLTQLKNNATVISFILIRNLCKTSEIVVVIECMEKYILIYNVCLISDSRL